VVVAPGQAELAFVVIDQYQGKGIGSALMRHLATIAGAAGLRELVADVLPGNSRMLKVFGKSGLGVESKRESGVMHLTLRLPRQ
jgi:ribosomal protein S18 acetylase RimI-like enzyme